MKNHILQIKDVYIPLLEDFLEDRISAWDFQDKYRAAIYEDPYIYPKPEIYRLLQDIFEDALAYEPEPDTREGSMDIDEKELRRCCEKNLQKLRAIV